MANEQRANRRLIILLGLLALMFYLGSMIVMALK